MGIAPPVVAPPLQPEALVQSEALVQPEVLAKPPGTAMRRLAELAAEATARPKRAAPAPVANVPRGVETPAEAAPARRYALLNDIAGVLPARRTRARTGKRA